MYELQTDIGTITIQEENGHYYIYLGSVWIHIVDTYKEALDYVERIKNRKF